MKHFPYISMVYRTCKVIKNKYALGHRFWPLQCNKKNDNSIKEDQTGTVEKNVQLKSASSKI